MNLETKITIYKFTPQLFTLTHEDLPDNYGERLSKDPCPVSKSCIFPYHSIWNLDTSSAGSCTKFCEILCQVLLHALTISVKRFNIYFQK